MELLILAILIGGAVLIFAKPRIGKGYVNGQPTDVILASIGKAVDGTEVYMRADAAVAFTAMKVEAEFDGIPLTPSGERAAFRTTDMQVSLANEEPDLAAPVNVSHHQAGTCVDINENQQGVDSPIYQWLVANAHRFHFAPTAMPKEPWHWEYMG